MKVTIAEIHNAFEWLTNRVIALQNHTIINPDVDDVMARLEKHGIQLDYVPMTDGEWLSVNHAMYHVVSASYRKLIEQAVLNRLGVALDHIPDSGKMVLDQAKAICEANGFSVVPKSIELDYAKAVCNANGIATNVPLVSYDKRSKLEAAKEVKL